MKELNGNHENPLNTGGADMGIALAAKTVGSDGQGLPPRVEPGRSRGGPPRPAVAPTTYHGRPGDRCAGATVGGVCFSAGGPGVPRVRGGPLSRESSLCAQTLSLREYNLIPVRARSRGNHSLPELSAPLTLSSELDEDNGARLSSRKLNGSSLSSSSSPSAFLRDASSSNGVRTRPLPAQ